MKFVLYCNLPYAFSMLKPIADELQARGFEYIWYVPNSIQALFAYCEDAHTSNIADIYKYRATAIFVPGNEVPWYLSGVKVQIFHGLAGEKKGYFRIRDYFDLYLTQGPYFTQRFQALAKKHKNFKVCECGWAKLDKLFIDADHSALKNELFPDSYNNEKIVLYAPTFSPSLNSARALLGTFKELLKSTGHKYLVKFHDKMAKELTDLYAGLAGPDFVVTAHKDITSLLQISDVMVSDTSSVVYEFLLLNKPVISLNSRSKNTFWFDINDPDQLPEMLTKCLSDDFVFPEQAKHFINEYHPYKDGHSAKRKVDAVLAYIDEFGVPERRKVPLGRKIKTYRKYRYIPSIKEFLIK